MATLAEQARAAFAAGWAAAAPTAPVTARTRVALQAAVDTAIDTALAHQHAAATDSTGPSGPVGVLEVTLDLGSLEGTWAEIYARREKLYTQHTASITKAWQAWMAAEFDPAAVVGAFQRAEHLTAPVEAASDTEQRRKHREAAAIAAALTALHRLLADTSNEHYRQVITATEQALRDGTAEGTASAVAILAQLSGAHSVDFDAAYADARAALVDVEQYQAQAAAWAKKTGEAAARALGRRLARQADDDASGDELLDTASDTDSDKGWLAGAAAAFADWATGHAMALGVTAVYASLSIASVNWVTVGDATVCATCQDYEDGSPYSLFTAPSPPAHPRCRCTTEPAGAIASLGRFAHYLIS